MSNKDIENGYKKIEEDIENLLTFKEVENGLLKTKCLKNKDHIAYYDKKTNKIFCPYCKYETNLVDLSAKITGVSEVEMLYSILIKKLNQKNSDIVDLVKEVQKINKNKELYYEINEKALVIFQEEFKNNMFAQKYVFEKRKMTKKIVNDFKIGFAPKTNPILKKLTKKYSLELLCEVGLLGFNKENNQYYDFFSNRIMFPVYNKNNRIIAFGGRTIGNSKTKYLNSPTTSVFKKSQELYALNTLDKNKKYPYILCLEGYMDVIALKQEGIENVVANLGTAFTEEHLRVLSKYTDKIILMLDGDEAGVSAMKRSICKVGNVNTLVLPENLDPDEYIKKYSKEQLLDYINNNNKNWNESMCKVLVSETKVNDSNLFEKLIYLKEF